MATPREIDQKTRKMAERQIDKGKEMEAFQQGQAELMGIQAQRQQALQSKAIEDNAELGQQQIMAQAAELGAMSAAAGGGRQQVLGQQVAAMNPQTQAILGKYGVPTAAKPGVTSRREVKQTPDKVTINNTTTTNNKITITQPNIPMKPVVVNQGGNDQGTISKFKTWMSNVFAQQKEQKVIRDKEYQRKEWSLERSSSRLTRTLEKIGKTIGERLDPRKLASGTMSQMKLLMILMGLNKLPEYWPKILGFITDAGNFFSRVGTFLGISGGKLDWKNSELHETIIKALGGQEGEDIPTAFRELFFGKGEGETDKNKGLFPYLLDKLKKMFNFEERWKAVQGVKWPESESPGLSWPLSGLFDGVKGAMTNLADYLKDVLTALFTGKTPVPKHVVNKIEKEAAGEMESGGNWGNKNAASYEELGDAAAFENYAGKGKAMNTILHSDLNDEGKLNNGMGASIRLSNAVYSMATSTEAGSNIGAMMTGLNRLKTYAQEHEEEGVAVRPQFLKALENYGISEERLEELGIGKTTKKAKFVWGTGEARDSYDPRVYDHFKEQDDRIKAGKAQGDDKLVEWFRGVFGGDGTSGIENTKGETRKLLVSADDSRQGIDPLTGQPSDKTINVKVLYKSDFEKIEQELAKLANLDTFELSVSDANAAAFLEQESVKRRQEAREKAWRESPYTHIQSQTKAEIEKMNNIARRSGYGVYKMDATYEMELNLAKKKLEERKRKAEEEDEEDDPNYGWSATRMGQGQDYVVDKVTNLASDAVDYIQEKTGWNIKGAINFAKGKAKNIVETAASYINPDNKGSDGRFRGDIAYSQTGPRDIDKGSADCSSFVAGVYRKAGIDVGKPSAVNCGNLWMNTNGVTVDFGGGINKAGKGNNTKAINESNLQPGDSIFFRRDSQVGNRPYGVGHVGIYVGNGKYIDHGDGKGPRLTNLNADRENYVGARRFANTSGLQPVVEELVNESYEDSSTGDSDLGSVPMTPQKVSISGRHGVSEAGINMLFAQEGWYDKNSNKGQGTVGTDSIAGDTGKGTIAVGPGLTQHINGVEGLAKKIEEGQTYTPDEIWQNFDAVLKNNKTVLEREGATPEKYGQGGMDALSYIAYSKGIGYAQLAAKQTNNAKELADWIRNPKNLDYSAEGSGAKKIIPALAAIAEGSDASGNALYDAYIGKGSSANAEFIRKNLNGSKINTISYSGGSSSSEDGGFFGALGNIFGRIGSAIKGAFEDLPSLHLEKPIHGEWEKADLETALSDFTKKTGADARALANGDVDKIAELLSKEDSKYDYSISQNTSATGPRYILERRENYEKTGKVELEKKKEDENYVELPEIEISASSPKSIEHNSKINSFLKDVGINEGAGREHIKDFLKQKAEKENIPEDKREEYYLKQINNLAINGGLSVLEREGTINSDDPLLEGELDETVDAIESLHSRVNNRIDSRNIRKIKRSELKENIKASPDPRIKGDGHILDTELNTIAIAPDKKISFDKDKLEVSDIYPTIAPLPDESSIRVRPEKASPYYEWQLKNGEKVTLPTEFNKKNKDESLTKFYNALSGGLNNKKKDPIEALGEKQDKTNELLGDIRKQSLGNTTVNNVSYSNRTTNQRTTVPSQTKR